MTASNDMIMGGFLGLAFFAMSLFLPIVPPIIVSVFACGALFGKGYGVWQERNRRPRP